MPLQHTCLQSFMTMRALSAIVSRLLETGLFGGWSVHLPTKTLWQCRLGSLLDGRPVPILWQTWSSAQCLSQWDPKAADCLPVCTLAATLDGHLVACCLSFDGQCELADAALSELVLSSLLPLSLRCTESWVPSTQGCCLQ